MSNVDKMLEKAREVMQFAYAPYSNFKVGACIRAEDGSLHVGCNIENASYGLALCAEASAIAALISSGHKEIHEILVIGSGDFYCSPCGACRQRLYEFSVKNHIPVYMCNSKGEYQQSSMSELLPFGFNLRTMEK
jgi:cytidine deaminase